MGLAYSFFLSFLCVCCVFYVWLHIHVDSHVYMFGLIHITQCAQVSQSNPGVICMTTLHSQLAPETPVPTFMSATESTWHVCGVHGNSDLCLSGE